MSFSLWEEHKESALLIPVKLYLMYEKEDCIIHGIFSLLYRYDVYIYIGPSKSYTPFKHEWFPFLLACIPRVHDYVNTLCLYDRPYYFFFIMICAFKCYKVWNQFENAMFISI